MCMCIKSTHVHEKQTVPAKLHSQTYTEYKQFCISYICIKFTMHTCTSDYSSNLSLNWYNHTKKQHTGISDVCAGMWWYAMHLYYRYTWHYRCMVLNKCSCTQNAHKTQITFIHQPQ